MAKQGFFYSEKGVVYKVHSGWFINRTPGEFINPGLSIKFVKKRLLQKSEGNFSEQSPG